MIGKRYRERVIANHHVKVREFVDLDGGCHYKWLRFTLAGREYPVGSFDILRHEEIDWAHTKEITSATQP